MLIFNVTFLAPDEVKCVAVYHCRRAHCVPILCSKRVDKDGRLAASGDYPIIQKKIILFLWLLHVHRCRLFRILFSLESPIIH